MYQQILNFNEFQLEHITNNRWYPSSVINEMLKVFNHENYEENMFPLLFFILNKKKCVELAKSINTIFNTAKETAEVDAFIIKNVGRNSGSNRSPFSYLHQMEQFDLVWKLAKKGIGIHHSGLLPILKEIVEQLYEMKLIKVLFATETFAVGLNMPTKTVVFCDLAKHSNEGHRLLHSHEFIQMAGRAGRRNIDTKGYIILLPQLFRNQLTTTEMVQMIFGGGQKIVSKLNIDELLILRLLKANTYETNLTKLVEYVKNSMLADSNKSQIAYQQNIVNDLELGVDTINKDEQLLIKELIMLTNPVFTLSPKQHKRLKELSSKTDLMSKFRKYESFKLEKNRLSDLINCIEINVQSQLDHLEKHNMISYDGEYIVLTNRGVIGSYIIDQNPIIIADIIMSDFFKKIIQPSSESDISKEHLYNIITLFSVLTFDDHISDSIDIAGFVEQNKSNPNIMWKDFINDLLGKYHSMGETTLIDKFNFDYVWLLDEFIRTSVYPSKVSDSDYLFEGNFVRSVNRLLNLLNEIRNVAQDTENTGLMSIFEKCRLELFQDKPWLIPDSIYLRKCGFVLQTDSSLVIYSDSNEDNEDNTNITPKSDFDDVFCDV